jgi:uncharacterized protein (DUF1684 family)
MYRERTAATGVLLFAVALAGCPGPETGQMVSVAPPPGWHDRLTRDRELKDRQYRSSPESPLLEADRAGFQGLSYWPADEAYYFLGPINFYPSPERFEIVATSGKQRPCERVGWVGIELHGTPQRLQVYRLLDSPDPTSFFLPFMDATTGKETYPSGRYLELDGRVGGPYVIDFNRAHNPSCAYGDPGRFACPVTPAENRLGVVIEAGERGFHERGSEG